jgi:hypothetical protein
MADAQQSSGAVPSPDREVRILKGDHFTSVEDREEIVEALRGRAIAEGEAFIAIRTSGGLADVEYDLAHLDRRLAPWAVELLDCHDGFHGSAYGMLRRIDRAEAEGVARHVADLVVSPDATLTAAAAARLRRRGGEAQAS